MEAGHLSLLWGYASDPSAVNGRIAINSEKQMEGNSQIGATQVCDFIMSLDFSIKDWNYPSAGKEVGKSQELPSFEHALDSNVNKWWQVTFSYKVGRASKNLPFLYERTESWLSPRLQYSEDTGRDEDFILPTLTESTSSIPLGIHLNRTLKLK